MSFNSSKTQSRSPAPSNQISPKKVYTFNNITLNGAGAQSFFDALYSESDADQYILVFANCLVQQRQQQQQQLNVSMDVRSAMYNLEGKFGSRDYLSVGRTLLPRVYFLFSPAYFSLAGVWVYHVLYKKRLTVCGNDLFMLAVIIFKALNLLCEAEDKAYIGRTGNGIGSGGAHGWNALPYILSPLSTLILVVGIGWSFVKPYLEDMWTKVLMIVIPLGVVVVNIAQVAIDVTGPHRLEDWPVEWKLMLQYVEDACYIAICFAMVWSLHNLREAAARMNGKESTTQKLVKFTLFLHYYHFLVIYACLSKLGVCVLETLCSYQYVWTSVVAGELATLAFCAFTVYEFRPDDHEAVNPDHSSEEEAAAARKLEEDVVVFVTVICSQD